MPLVRFGADRRKRITDPRKSSRYCPRRQLFAVSSGTYLYNVVRDTPAAARSRTPTRWNTSRPPGVVVSRDSCRDRNPIPRRHRSATICDQVPKAAAEPIQRGDDEGVAGAHMVQARRQLFALSDL